MVMGLQEANQNFSKLVRAIRAGKTVTLTDRGKPLATVAPVTKPRRKGLSEQEALEEAAIDRLEAMGFVAQRGTGKPTRQKGWKPIRLRGGKSIVETLQEIREDRV